jgi:zinc protease
VRSVRPRLFALALLALPLCLEPRAAAASPPREEPTAVLANGLEVFLHPLTGATEVALVVVFRVGGRNDPAGKSGLAHLVEHCYVTAAAGESPARSYAEIMARYGAGHTAQTADAHMIVAQVFPPERLEEEVKDAAARMGALRVVAEDLAREKPRVLEELANMFDRVPDLAARNRARERVLPTPGGGRRGGSPVEVEALTLQDVQGFWSRCLRPRNAVLALAGAVGDGAFALLQKHFGGLPRGDPPPVAAAPPLPVPARPPDDVEVATPMPGMKGMACMAYAAPAPGSEEYAAFLLFVARLLEPAPATGGTAVSVTFAPLDEPGAVYLQVPLEPGIDAEAATRELERIQARVSDVVGTPWSPRDAARVTQSYGFLLGLLPLGYDVLAQGPRYDVAKNPYGVALGLAARRVLGVDADLLRGRLAKLPQAPLARSGARLFDPLAAGAATVRVRKAG